MNDAIPESGTTSGGPGADEPVLYCVFLGCSQRGVPTEQGRCPECNRHTSPMRPTRPTPAEPAPSFAPPASGPSDPGLPWMQPRPQRATPLVADALRVAGVFNILSWIVVILGVLTGLLVAFTYLSAEDVLGALLGVATAAAYTAGAWAFMMLGSIVARHLPTRTDPRARFASAPVLTVRHSCAHLMRDPAPDPPDISHHFRRWHRK